MSKKKASASTDAKKRKVEQQRLRREKYIQGWRSLGIDDAIISSKGLRNKNPAKVSNTDLIEIKKASRTAKAKRTKAINMKRREQILKDAGYKVKDVPKSILLSDKRLFSFMGKVDPLEVFNAKYYLAVCASLVRGDIILNTFQYKNHTFEEIIAGINERLSDWENDPDDSGTIRVVFQIFHGSKSECEEHLALWSERGYNLKIGKFTDARYFRLVNRNDWSMRELGELMLCMFDQVHNKDIPEIYRRLKFFVDEAELPFKELFTYSFNN